MPHYLSFIGVPVCNGSDKNTKKLFIAISSKIGSETQQVVALGAVEEREKHHFPLFDWV